MTPACYAGSRAGASLAAFRPALHRLPQTAAAAQRPPRGRLLVPAAAAQSAASDAPSQALSLVELRSGLEEAVKAEDYATAARIRDRIAQYEREDPVLQVEAQLAAAVAEQRFQVRPSPLPPL